jgi:hypothetical protein
MGTLHQNRKGVPVEVKSAKLKEGEPVLFYTDKLMTRKWFQLGFKGKTWRSPK